MNNKIPLSERKFYPVFFMIALIIVFIGALAIFYHLTQKRVQLYKESQLHKMILRTFDLPTYPIEENYRAYITEETQHDFDYYLAKKSEAILGYCFPIEGSGLWGTIRALVAFNKDFSQLIGFTIIEQNETPGLGARITEERFQQQFQNKKILSNGKVIKYILIPENKKPEENQIQQITGATSSSRAVVTMLYKNTLKIIQQFKIQ